MVGWQREGGRDYNVLHEHGVIIAFAKPLMLYSHVVRPRAPPCPPALHCLIRRNVRSSQLALARVPVQRLSLASEPSLEHQGAISRASEPHRQPISLTCSCGSPETRCHETASRSPSIRSPPEPIPRVLLRGRIGPRKHRRCMVGYIRGSGLGETVKPTGIYVL